MGIDTYTKTLITGLAFFTTMATAQPQPQTGEYFEVRQSRGVSTVSVGGTIIPYKQVTLAAQMPGRIIHIAGIEGDAFKRGAVLVSLDTAELRAARRAAVAQLMSANAQLRNAGVQYSREIWSPRSKAAPGGMGMPSLFDQMFTRPLESWGGQRQYGAERYSDLYSSGVAIQKARSAIAQLHAQIQQIDAKLRNAKSIAPFDGVIMKKFVERGDTMQPGQPLLKYADVEYLQMEVDVPARLRPGLREGMMLKAQLDDLHNRIVPVRVAQIFPMADVQRHTIKVKFDLPQNVSAPGMYAKVLVPDITAPTKNNPIIPTSAIRYNGSLPGVYVKGPDGNKLRLIRVGEQLPNGYTTVLSGLQPGDKVLQNPPTGMTQGWNGTNPKTPDR